MGRLIDADGFIEYLRKYAYPDSFITGVQLALNGVPSIQQERTANLFYSEDEAGFDYGVCKNCGKMHADWDVAVMFNYCTECGAKFVQEDNHEAD